MKLKCENYRVIILKSFLFFLRFLKKECIVVMMRDEEVGDQRLPFLPSSDLQPTNFMISPLSLSFSLLSGGGLRTRRNYRTSLVRVAPSES
jgi:hypothetical protein